MFMSNEQSEKFTTELANLNINLALLNQRVGDALELAEKNMELRFAEHERDCPGRNRKKDSVPPAASSGSWWSEVDPKQKARLVNMLIALLTAGGTILTMKFGL